MFTRTSYAQQQYAKQKHYAKKIKVNQQQPYGSYLTDGEGMSLYLFLKDSGGKSTCYNQCAEEWPPALTNSKQVNGGSGVQSSMLGTVKRKDGSLQITYNGHPLYYYNDDKKAGDVKGQDEKGFGAEWYLVKPSGKKMGDVKEKGGK
jgi:predicted lipoprotein with Yx(FWY)xxD motif